MTDKPNVLVIMSDQQKATASHLYGNTFCQTPSMQRLADERVVLGLAISAFARRTSQRDADASEC